VVSNDNRCKSRATAAHRVEDNEEAAVDRRQFLVSSVIGAASVLAVAENASAATNDNKPSDLVASASDVHAIDTKAIFNKAAK